MTTSVHRSVLNLVGGQWLSSPEHLEVRNPADTRELVATVPSMDARACTPPSTPPSKAATPGEGRARWTADVSFSAPPSSSATVRTSSAGRLTLEMGKTLAEARGEVGKAADFFEYYGGLGRAERGSLLVPREPRRDVVDRA